MFCCLSVAQFSLIIIPSSSSVAVSNIIHSLRLAFRPYTTFLAEARLLLINRIISCQHHCWTVLILKPTGRTQNTKSSSHKPQALEHLHPIVPRPQFPGGPCAVDPPASLNKIHTSTKAANREESNVVSVGYRSALTMQAHPLISYGTQKKTIWSTISSSIPGRPLYGAPSRARVCHMPFPNDAD